MAHRRKKDTEKTLELVIWLILGIPMAIIVVLKWIFSGIKKNGTKSSIQLECIDLQDIDQMDGFSFEYYVAELLRKNGYKQVHVTSGSGDFGVDITAYKDNIKYAFQCKKYQSNLGISPIQEIYSGAPKYDASVCVVVTNSYFTHHAVELAECLNVILWDRTELAKLIKTSHNESSAFFITEENINERKLEINNSILTIPISGGFVPATLILTQQNLIYQTKQNNQVYPITAVVEVSRFVARLKIVIINRKKPLNLAVGNVNNAIAMEQAIQKLLIQQQKQ